MTEQPGAGAFGQPDPRSPDEKLADLRKVQRQVIALLSAKSDSSLADRHLAAIQDRRSRRSGAKPFREIPAARGGTTLAAEAELLIRSEAYDDVRLFLSAHGVDIEATEDVLDGSVKRLVGRPGVSTQALAQVASALRRWGVPISANHVAPMGIPWKSLTGPENSEGGPPRLPVFSSDSTVRVAVIDTGVSAATRTDGWLDGLETEENAEDLYREEDEQRQHPDHDDLLLNNSAGHGTFIAGIVRQVAPAADLKVYRVLDTDGVSDEVSIAEAMVTAAREGLEAGKHVVISLSVGTETADDERPVALSVALEQIEDLEAGETPNPGHREVLVVAAAGNYGHDRPCYPAAFPNVTAVAALTQGLRPADWSSRGAWIDVSTIGEGVRSTFVRGVEPPELDPEPDVFPNDAWALWTGTSFAAPQIAAAIAQRTYESGGQLTPREAKRLLLRGRAEVPLYGRLVEVLPAI